jgi:P-type Mg2+ transporter
VAWAPDRPARLAVLPALDGLAGGAVAPVPVLRRLDSGPQGLTEAQAQARLERFGENAVAAARPPTWLARLLTAARSPFVLLLTGLALVSAATRDVAGAAVIAVLAAASCALRMHQEHRSDQAAAALRAMVASTATVVRRAAPGRPPAAREVPLDQLVPGDIVRLAAGDLVPADLILLRSADLTVSQAVLTGESLPAAKHPASLAGDASPAAGLDAAHLCFMGTTVVSGSGTGAVVATGASTCLGSAQRDPRPSAETSFERGVRGIAWALVCFMLVCVPVVLAVSAALRGHPLEAFLFAVAVAVGLTPEMLPVVITTTLARGARRMAGQSVIVKRLPALHNVGAMDVLCTDKTGTLTEDQLTLDRAMDPAGRDDPQVLRWAELASRALVEAGDLLAELDPLDLAVLEHVGGAGPEPEAAVVDVVPFDSARRRATAVLRDAARPGRHTLVTRGAPEAVLACCTTVRSAGRDVPFGPARRRRAEALAEVCAADGVRLLAVAVAERPARLGRYGPADEADLTLVGFVAFRDQPRESARGALAGLAAAGVGIKIITGDHPKVAARICRDVGLDPGVPLTGPEIAELDDPALASLAEQVTVFARVDPRQKARIVQALRQAGHTVGFLGDGLNDVAALRAADVGISVAGAVAAAREHADVILLRQDLGAVGQAVRQGRRAFGNMAKYLKITVSANLGNVLSMLVASAALPFLPMLPIQVLVQNLCFDGCQLALAFDTVDDPEVARPRSFDARDLTRFALFIGPVNMVADLATFAVLWWIIGRHASPAGAALLRTGWLTENLLTQAAAVHLLRSRHRPSARHHAARPVLLATAALAAVALALPYTPLAGALGLRALPLAFFPPLAVIVACYCLATSAAKAACLRGRSL